MIKLTNNIDVSVIRHYSWWVLCNLQHTIFHYQSVNWKEINKRTNFRLRDAGLNFLVNNKCFVEQNKTKANSCLFKPIKCQCCPHIETNQLICFANQLTGFCMRARLALNGLMVSVTMRSYLWFFENMLQKYLSDKLTTLL